MKLSNINANSSVPFKAKYAIKRSSVQGQLNEFMDLIAQKGNFSKQISTTENDQGSEVIIDIHNRFKQNFEKLLDDMGIYWEQIIEKAKK